MEDKSDILINFDGKADYSNKNRTAVNGISSEVDSSPLIYEDEYHPEQSILTINDEKVVNSHQKLTELSQSLVQCDLNKKIQFQRTKVEKCTCIIDLETSICPREPTPVPDNFSLVGKEANENANIPEIIISQHTAENFPLSSSIQEGPDQSKSSPSQDTLKVPSIGSKYMVVRHNSHKNRDLNGNISMSDIEIKLTNISDGANKFKKEQGPEKLNSSQGDLSLSYLSWSWKGRNMKTYSKRHSISENFNNRTWKSKERQKISLSESLKPAKNKFIEMFRPFSESDRSLESSTNIEEFLQNGQIEIHSPEQHVKVNTAHHIDNSTQFKYDCVTLKNVTANLDDINSNGALKLPRESRLDQFRQINAIKMFKCKKYVVDKSCSKDTLKNGNCATGSELGFNNYDSTSEFSSLILDEQSCRACQLCVNKTDVRMLDSISEKESDAKMYGVWNDNFILSSCEETKMTSNFYLDNFTIHDRLGSTELGRSIKDGNIRYICEFIVLSVNNQVIYEMYDSKKDLLFVAELSMIIDIDGTHDNVILTSFECFVTLAGKFENIKADVGNCEGNYRVVSILPINLAETRLNSNCRTDHALYELTFFFEEIYISISISLGDRPIHKANYVHIYKSPKKSMLNLLSPIETYLSLISSRSGALNKENQVKRVWVENKNSPLRLMVDDEIECRNMCVLSEVNIPSNEMTNILKVNHCETDYACSQSYNPMHMIETLQINNLYENIVLFHVIIDDENETKIHYFEASLYSQHVEFDYENSQRVKTLYLPSFCFMLCSSYPQMRPGSILCSKPSLFRENLALCNQKLAKDINYSISMFANEMVSQYMHKNTTMDKMHDYPHAPKMLYRENMMFVSEKCTLTDNIYMEAEFKECFAKRNEHFNAGCFPQGHRNHSQYGNNEDDQSHQNDIILKFAALDVPNIISCDPPLLLKNSTKKNSLCSVKGKSKGMRTKPISHKKFKSELNLRKSGPTRDYPNKCDVNLETLKADNRKEKYHSSKSIKDDLDNPQMYTLFMREQELYSARKRKEYVKEVFNRITSDNLSNKYAIKKGLLKSDEKLVDKRVSDTPTINQYDLKSRIGNKTHQGEGGIKNCDSRCLSHILKPESLSKKSSDSFTDDIWFSVNDYLSAKLNVCPVGSKPKMSSYEEAFSSTRPYQIQDLGFERNFVNANEKPKIFKKVIADTSNASAKALINHLDYRIPSRKDHSFLKRIGQFSQIKK